MTEINFSPSAKQWQAWEYLNDDITTEIGYGGAASGGKSYLGCVWITCMCLANPDSGWLIGRKELTNLKRTTLITLFKVFKEFGITEKQYNYNQQNNVLTFGNGSQIFFIDLGYKPSDPLYTRLGGLELTGGFIDESNEIPYQAIEILKTRIGRRGKLKPKLLETFNPDKGHVYSRYFRPWKDKTLPEYRQFLQALPDDNPYTSKEYIEQLKNADKITRERLLYGNFEYDDDPTILIKNDAFEDLWTNTVDNNNRFISVDVARFGKDTTRIGLWSGLQLDKVWTFTKYAVDQTAEEVKRIATDYRVPFSQIIIDEDGVGGGVLDLLRGAKGFMGNSVPFPVWDSRTYKFVPANYQNLRNQCYFTLAEYVNNHKMAIKDETIKETLREDFSVIRQKNIDTDGKLSIISKDEMKEIIGRSPDVSDMLMMRMYFEFKKPAEQRSIELKAQGVFTKMKNRVNYVE
ncbi:MAG: terminase family protein [Saprospiraceae bacterium]|nr:terminase family protein [Saprospiraceae bacterium]